MASPFLLGHLKALLSSRNNFLETLTAPNINIKITFFFTARSSPSQCHLPVFTHRLLTIAVANNHNSYSQCGLHCFLCHSDSLPTPLYKYYFHSQINLHCCQHFHNNYHFHSQCNFHCYLRSLSQPLLTTVAIYHTHSQFCLHCCFHIHSHTPR